MCSKETRRDPGSPTSSAFISLHRPHLPILFEIIPPPKEAKRDEIRATARAIEAILSHTLFPVAALNLPEIRPESRSSPRPQDFKPKLAPRDFAKILRDELSHAPQMIINRVVVHAPGEAQLRWFYRTYHEYAIDHIIVVGGESSQIRYPGPSVTKAAALITQHLNHGHWPYGNRRKVRPTNLTLGGITIPTRRRPDPHLDEPARMIRKIRNGISFFTTQVLYEAESICQLLRDYTHTCIAEGVEPAPLYLSFAPVSAPSDVKFLKWLGVEIPETIEHELLTGWLGTGMRSVRVSERILETILHFVEQEKLTVPLGLNVEHVTSRNFEIAGEMIDRLASVMNRHARLFDPTETAEMALQLAGLDPDMVDKINGKSSASKAPSKK